MSLKNIRIVLVRPTHPGNIGATARAMKNMCLEDLCLVAPKDFPSPQANARAGRAEDVLARAAVVNSLDEALKECHLVVGSSGRPRRIEWPMLDPRTCGEKLVSGAGQGKVALLFGRERNGLTNAELDRCQFVVQIPANADYPSLNIACAVQVLAYEIFLAGRQFQTPSQGLKSTPASHDDMQHFYRHLQETLVQIGFLDPQSPRLLMRRLIRMYNRASPDDNELNILRGILTAIQRHRPQT